MSSADDFKNLGNQEFKNKNFDKAIEFYSKAIELNPAEITYYSNRSGSYASLGKFQEALDDANKCIEINPAYVKGYSRKGLALQRLGREEDALEAYDAGLKIDPNNEGLKADKASITDAAQQSMGDFMSLLNNPEIKKMMQENPQMLQTMLQNPGLFKDPTMLANMMNLFGKKGGAPGQQKAPAHDATKGDEGTDHTKNPWDKPDQHAHKEPHDHKAAHGHDHGDHGDHCHSHDHGHSHQPHDHHKAEPKAAPKAEPPKLTPWDEEKQKADGEYKKRNFEAAIGHYNECIKLDENNLLAYNNKAACLIELKKLDEAMAAVDEAIARYKETEHKLRNYQHFAKTLARKGRIFQLQNKLDLAQKCLEDSLLEDKSPQVEESLREVKRAIKKAEEAAYIDPAKGEAHREAGNDFFNKGEFGKALQEYEESKRRNPNEPKVYYNTAICFSKIMKYNEAMKEIDRAIELDPRYIKAWVRKGNLHNLLKEHHKALDAFKKVLGFEPENQEGKAGIEQTQMKIASSMYEGNDEERTKRSMNDPEIVSIMSDPMVRIALEQMQANPRNIMEYMNDSTLGPKINKLIAAGIIKTK